LDGLLQLLFWLFDLIYSNAYVLAWTTPIIGQ
jgi:hypothetical protein